MQALRNATAPTIFWLFADAFGQLLQVLWYIPIKSYYLSDEADRGNTALVRCPTKPPYPYHVCNYQNYNNNACYLLSTPHCFALTC